MTCPADRCACSLVEAVECLVYAGWDPDEALAEAERWEMFNDGGPGAVVAAPGPDHGGDAP